MAYSHIVSEKLDGKEAARVTAQVIGAGTKRLGYACLKCNAIATLTNDFRIWCPTCDQVLNSADRFLLIGFPPIYE